MAIREALRRAGKALHADVEPAGDGLALELTLAKRETPAALRHLRYRVQLDVDEEERTVYFSETLWERGPAGAGVVDLAPKFGGKEETYRVQPVPAGPAGLESQLVLFEKRYGVRFDFAPLRMRLKRACEEEGYDLRHLVPV